MAWADEVAALNSEILSEFGEAATITRPNSSSEDVSVVWRPSDAAGSPRTNQVQCKQSAFTGALPVKGDRLVLNGVTYFITEPERLDGDWMRLELRRLAGGDS